MKITKTNKITNNINKNRETTTIKRQLNKKYKILIALK
jgi:hypothetical protein